MIAHPQSLEPALVARSFDRASGSYDAAAALQATVRNELLERLELLQLKPATILDLGAGTGLGAAALKSRYHRARVIALDIAPGMLREARKHSRFWRRIETVAASATQMPLPARSVDLVFSSLMLQWCEDLDAAFTEVARVLKLGGAFMFSSFGPDTLGELRDAWASVDEVPHVNRFLDMHDVGSALTHAGFAEPVLDVERHRLHYPDVLSLLRSLKSIGAHNVTAGRQRSLTGKQRYAAMTAAYETLRRDGRLPATWEVVYGVAWGGTPRAAPGEMVLPFAIGPAGRRL
ncbi:MAG: malonyl-ACP O-methyltransferase BioC [Steroidobacteraceae bacterium]